MARPRTGKTPIRQVRIDDETWRRVEQAAKEDHTDSSKIVRQAVTEHLDRRDQQHGS